MNVDNSVGKLSWHDLDVTMMKDDGKDIRFGEKAVQLTDKYEASRSHGAKRVLLGIITLGFNELARSCNTKSYNKEMKKLSDSVQNFYEALAPKLEDSEQGEIQTKAYVEKTSENVMIADEKVTVKRFANGGGKVEIPKNGKEQAQTIDITDCDKLRSQIEQDVMKHAKLFDSGFVKGILDAHMKIVNGNVGIDSAMLNNRTISVDGANIVRAAQTGESLRNRDKDDLNQVAVREQYMSPKEAAQMRLRIMLSAFYEGTLGLPPEVGRTMDISIGVDLVPKVLSGEITDPDKLKAFLDNGSKNVHLANAESQKLLAKYEKARTDNSNAVDEKVKIDEKYRNAINDKQGTFVPSGESKKVHDFVADLILNGDEYDYDKDVHQGQQTGARLAHLIKKNAELVGRMMDPDNRDEMLKTLDPEMRKILEKNVLEKLEKSYQKDCDEKKAQQKDPSTREKYLEKMLVKLEADEAKRRVAVGTRDVNTLPDVELDALGENENFKDTEEIQKLKKDEPYLADNKDEIQKTLDFFGTIEVSIDADVAKACQKVQKQISDKVDTMFKATGKNGGLNAQEIGNKSLDDLHKEYSKDQDVELIKATLKVYFEKMPPLAQRQMIAAQTRYCMSVDPKKGDAAPSGVQLGALLKGAGPVMQKMLQGVNPALIEDADMKIALADMKDNLAPVSDKAIQAYLFDIVERGKNENPAIESITVVDSLGQASVGQALLCKLKRVGMAEEDVVVKLLRPNANLAARREQAIFADVARGLGAGTADTFAGRFKSIMAELDLTAEAQNVQRGAKVYDYGHNKAHPFTNVKSAMLAPGCKPTSNTMVQQLAEGKTLKNWLAGLDEGLANDDVDLEDAKKLLEKTHSALENLAYMWAQEGLFGSGFYHGDLHEGNIMVDPGTGNLTVIDFGNATSLDANGRLNVTRVISGMAVSDADLFMKGYEALLESPESKEKFSNSKTEIKEKLSALLGDNHKGIARTAERLDLALKILQTDFGIEVPSAVHNFLESQRRLNDAMVNTAEMLKVVNQKLGEVGQKQPKSMISCLVDVVKNNIAGALKAIGLKNAKNVYDAIKGDLENLDAPPQGQQPGGQQDDAGKMRIDP